MHCYFAHSYDTGHRFTIQEQEMSDDDDIKSNDDGIDLVNKRIAHLTDILRRKKKLSNISDRRANTKWNQLSSIKDNKETNGLIMVIMCIMATKESIKPIHRIQSMQLQNMTH